MISRRRFLRGVAASATFLKAQSLVASTRPYVQCVSADRAWICWSSEQEEPDALIAGAPAFTRQVRMWTPAETGLDAPLWAHQVEISGLAAAREYVFGVLRPGLRDHAEVRFRTPGAHQVRFLAFGDSGAGSEPQRELAVLMQAEEAELIVHTGDLAYTGGTFPAFLERHFAIYADLLARTPLFPCLGNHEYGEPGARAYMALNRTPAAGVPPEDQGRYYSFDWGPVHFVALDSNAGLIAAAEGRGRMLEWLDRDLMRTRQPWKVVYFHHPPYASGRHDGNPISALARNVLVPVLERGGVQLVLNGHEHSYQRSRPIRAGRVAGDGVVYVTTGGGGGGLYPAPGGELLEFCASTHHYLRVAASASELRAEAVLVNGAILDAFAWRPPRAAPIPRPPEASRRSMAP